MDPSKATLLIALTMITATMPAMGFHGGAEEDPSRAVTFDPGSMNEWWVEVYLGGAEGEDVVRVEARDTDGPWVELTERDWGAWAASFHVEAGHEVQFAALLDTGVYKESCWYTHPDGVEARCDASGGGGDAGSGGAGFDATFSDVSGNEWWIEADVDAPDSLQGVEARVDGGDWKPLDLKSWGDWAASHHVPDGSLVQFRATSSTGATDFSLGGYAWPDQTPYPPAAGAFDARFHNVKTQTQWTQVNVYANEPLAAVDVRADDGDWKPLDLKRWGDWGASYDLRGAGSIAFRATSADGDVITTGDGGGGTGGGDAFKATFETPGGNEWWVEVYVDAAEPLAGVDASADGGPWHALEKKRWGAWAASLHVPDGSLVQFRATSENGDTALSGEYRWPEGTQVSATPGEETNVWPREGSFVKYEVHSGESSPGGDWSEDRDVNVTLLYENGAWTATCEGWHTERTYDYDTDETEVTRDRIQETATFEPARAPMGASEGDLTHAEFVRTGCASGAFGFALTVEGQTTLETTRNGESVTATAREAGYAPVWPESATVLWHPETGLVLKWSHVESSSGTRGEIVDTDAPIAKGDAPTSPPERQAWPFEGSYVEYADDTGAHMRLEYEQSYWQGLCTTGNGTRIHLIHEPLRNPTNVQEGDPVDTPIFVDCDRWPVVDVIVQGKFAEDTTRNGEPHTATAWWGDESAEDDANGIDKDAWWDTHTGLVLRWEEFGEYPETKGRLTDTDAPLSQA